MPAFERLSPQSALPASQYCLLAGVYGLALSLLLSLGTYKEALYLCALGTAGCLILGVPRARLDRPVWVMLGFGAVFLVQGWLMAARPIAGRFHLVLAWSMVAAMAVALLPDRIGRGLSHHTLLGGLLVAFVAVQTVAFEVVTKKYWAGLFSNIHYMAFYSVTTMPMLACLAVQAKSRFRWVFALALLGDFLLLMKTHSRPGYLALLAAALATVPFMAPRIRLAVLAGIVLVPALLYFSGLFGFAARWDDLITHFGEEERPAIWRETWGLLQKDSGLQWWLGHGFGQFYEDYLVIPVNHWWKDYYASPHNYVLELLYSHGWVGLILFVAAFVLFFRALASAVSGDTDGIRRQMGITLASIATAQFVIGFLTLPFFARHNLYPFSLVLGASLRYISIVRRHD
jgi:hypothetical protein